MKNYKLLFLLFTCFISLEIYAQIADKLVGKWQFKEMAGEDIDVKKAEMMEHLFGNMKLEFKKGGTYEVLVMGKEEKGTWEMDDMLVKQVSESGRVNEMSITSLTDEELVYVMGKDEVKMIKVKRFDLPAPKKPAKVVNVKASPDQIYGTWYFKEKELSVNNEAALAEAFLISMLEKAYFKYNEDGSYEDNASLNQVTTGTWKLEKDNMVLVIMKKKEVVYDIVGITKNEMKLVNRELDGVITFVREKPDQKEESIKLSK